MISLMMLSGIGCSSVRRDKQIDESINNNLDEKIKGEAYLFDVKLNRDGKLTSFRLEIYQTDSITAFSGRGYLGKGALKGILDNDSILVYFPVSNEFLYESTASLLDIKDCVNDLDNLNLISFLKNPPDEKIVNSNIEIISSFEATNEPQYTLYNPECSWQIEINYEDINSEWLIKSFLITDGFENTIKSTRRTYKKNAKIPYKRFVIHIPEKAERIIP